MRSKLIIIFILILIIGGAAGWFFYIKPRTNETTSAVEVFRSFFPIGSNDVTPDGLGGGDGTTTTPTESSGTQRKFTQITTTPIAGYTVFTKSTPITTVGTTTGTAVTTSTVTDHFLRYVARETGYVYEKKNDEQGIQISNIFIPNIYEAFFMDANKTAILRFLRPDSQTIATYSVPIPELNANNTRTQQAGVYLSDNITTVATNPNATTLLQLTNTADGSTISSVTSKNTGKKDVMKTPIKEWLLYWTQNSTLYVQTKASASFAGFLYKIDTKEGRLSRIVGDIPGITASISPDNKFVLYSMSTEEGFITRLLDVEKNTTATIAVSILPEKCTWLRNNDLICAGNTSIQPARYPDSWYAGITHFSDQLYKINTQAKTHTLLFNGAGYIFDMTNLQVDEIKNLLFFIDKPTGNLWQVTL